MTSPYRPFRIPRCRRHPRRQRSPRRPKLRFSPTAWAKLLYLRDRGPTEVGGFGITTGDDLLRVREVALVAQSCSEAFVAFDDLAVAEFFDRQIDLGQRPDQCGRIWIHTHPGHSAEPSALDRETFARVFGHCDWAVMMILARGGESFAELHWRHGGPATVPLDLEIDFSQPFAASDEPAWATEYDSLIRWELRSRQAHEMPRGHDGSQERNTPPNRPVPFEADSLANFCDHPLAWEMA